MPAGQIRRFALRERERPFADDQIVRFVEREGQLEVWLGGEYFTTYNFGPNVVRPYLYPVCAAAAASDSAPDRRSSRKGGSANDTAVGMTRNWPMVPDAQGETNDHPHHKGIYTAHGEVNEVDNWGEGEHHGYQIHRGFLRTFQGPVDAGFVEELDWTNDARIPNMSETRVIRFYAEGPGLRVMDYEVTLHAAHGRVVLGDTKEAGLLSIRVPTSMDAKDPNGGTITNGFGGLGEAETWGKPAPWCDYSGPVHGGTFGVTMMDHPENPRHPTPWHVRNYGLMTANCFGYHDFTGRDDMRRDFVLEAGASATWRYRVLIHEGDARAVRSGDRFIDYAFPPAVSQGI
jgi:hypothetical protein